MTVAAALVVVAAWTFGVGAGPWIVRSGATASAPLSPADARQREILKQNAGRPGDADLVRRFQSINAKHFASALPPVAVRWEPALADVGALTAQAFTLEGMFGNVGKELIILINPSVRSDRRALDRALCHEMVHAHLFATGDKTTNHGPAFKAVLHRLSKEGAFEGIAATDAERANLRAWIDEESARIDFERQQMDEIGRELTREREELDRDLKAHDARAASARAERRAAPSSADVEALEARRRSYNQRVLDTNARLERDRADLAHFNREVARYNLMIAYPDGLDEEPPVSPKATMRGAGGPT